MDNLIVTQFRYYGADNDKNVPSDQYLWFNGVKDDGATKKNLLTDYGPALKIGIQGLPGTVFHLNDNLGGEIMIDHTGVYELDLRDTTASISTLYFESDSLITINRVGNAPLIVDVLCYNKESN